MTTKVQEIEMTFECTYCGAAVGHRCQTETGYKIQHCHVSRYQQAVEAGLLPL